MRSGRKLQIDATSFRVTVTKPRRLVLILGVLKIGEQQLSHNLPDKALQAHKSAWANPRERAKV
jgi:hypothetical protein